MRASRPASKAFLAALAKHRAGLPAPKRRRANAPPFSVQETLAAADEILARLPARAHIKRFPTAGELRYRFALPLHLCKPQNRKAFADGWQFAKDRKALLQMLALQLRGLPKAPLSGRPIVQCIRFSSKAPDAQADSFKQAIDCLCPRRSRKVRGVARMIPGLGVIRNDDPDSADVRQRWEYSPSKRGFCVIEIYTGAEGGGK